MKKAGLPVAPALLGSCLGLALSLGLCGRAVASPAPTLDALASPLGGLERQDLAASRLDLAQQATRASQDLGAYLDQIASLLTDLAKGGADSDAGLVLKIDASSSLPVQVFTPDSPPTDRAERSALDRIWQQKRLFTAIQGNDGPAILVGVASGPEAYVVELPEGEFASRLASARVGRTSRAALVDGDGHVFLENGGNHYPLTREAVASLASRRQDTLVTGGYLLSHAMVGDTGWQLLLQLPLGEAVIGLAQSPAPPAAAPLQAPGSIVFTTHTAGGTGTVPLLSLLALGIVGLGTGRWLKQRSEDDLDAQMDSLPAHGFDLETIAEQTSQPGFPTPLLSTFVPDRQVPDPHGAAEQNTRALKELERAISDSSRQVREAVQEHLAEQQARLASLVDDVKRLQVDASSQLALLSDRQDAIEAQLAEAPGQVPDAQGFVDLRMEIAGLREGQIRLSSELANLQIQGIQAVPPTVRELEAAHASVFSQLQDSLEQEHHDKQALANELAEYKEASEQLIDGLERRMHALEEGRTDETEGIRGLQQRVDRALASFEHAVQGQQESLDQSLEIVRQLSAQHLAGTQPRGSVPEAELLSVKERISALVNQAEQLVVRQDNLADRLAAQEASQARVEKRMNTLSADMVAQAGGMMRLEDAIQSSAAELADRVDQQGRQLEQGRQRMGDTEQRLNAQAAASSQLAAQVEGMETGLRTLESQREADRAGFEEALRQATEGLQSRLARQETSSGIVAQRMEDIGHQLASQGHGLELRLEAVAADAEAKDRRLDQRISELAIARDRVEGQIQDLSDQLASQQETGGRRTQELREQLRSAQVQLDELRRGVDGLEGSLPERILQALPFAPHRVNDLAEQLESVRGRLTRQDEGLRDTQKAQVELASRLDRLDDRLETSVRPEDVAILRSQVHQDVLPRMQSLEAELRRLNTEWRETPQHPAVLAAQLAALKGKVAQFQADLEARQPGGADGSTIERIKAQIENELDARLDDLSRQLRAHRQEVGETSLRLKQFEDKLAAWEDRWEGLRAANSHEVETLLAQLGRMESDQEAEREAITRRFAELEAEQSRFFAELQHSMGSASDPASEQRQQALIENVSRELSELRSDQQEIHRSLAEAQGEWKASLAQLRTELPRWQAELDQVRSREHDRVDKLQDDIARTVEQVQRRIDDELQRARQASDLLREQLDQVKAGDPLLRSEVEAIRARLNLEEQARAALKVDWEGQLGKLSQESYSWIHSFKQNLLESVDRALNTGREAETRFAQALAAQQVRMEALARQQEAANDQQVESQRQQAREKQQVLGELEELKRGLLQAETLRRAERHQLESQLGAAIEESRQQLDKVLAAAPNTERLLRSLKESEARFVKVLSHQHLKVDQIEQDLGALKEKLGDRPGERPAQPRRPGVRDNTLFS